jgi:phosphoglycolate phosphatase
VTEPQVDPRLAEVLAATWPVLLDFDGPITPLMPAPMNWQIAENMRLVIRNAGHHVPGEIAASVDPLVLLRYAHSDLEGALRVQVEDTCLAGEIEAARTSKPTPGGHETLRACQTAGRPVVIVSNNAPEAVEAYLDVHNLRDLVVAVCARPYGRPDLMKPNPELVLQALANLTESAENVVFVGDSVSDIQAAKHGLVLSIGFAKTPERGAELSMAGADALVVTMAELAFAIRG